MDCSSAADPVHVMEAAVAAAAVPFPCRFLCLSFSAAAFPASREFGQNGNLFL